jgi:uncharacterized protein with PQ loop repeat
MQVWAVLAFAWLVIQAVEVHSKQNASGLSLAAFILYIFSSVLWYIYGKYAQDHVDKVVVISSVMAFVLGTVVLVGIILYGDTDSPK